jgi:uncharacterized membrane protein
MKELTQEEMDSLKGGFFDTNIAAVASLANAAQSIPVAVNVGGAQAVAQGASSAAGNQLVGILQVA